MITFKFEDDKIIMAKSALGGVIQAGLNYDKFPSVKNVPPDELEHLGLALMLGVASLELSCARTAAQAATQLVKEADGEPTLYVPSQSLIVPA